MVRFSCFNAHINSHKTKKTVPMSVEAMQKTLQDSSLKQGLKDFPNASDLNPIHLKEQEDGLFKACANDLTSSSSVDPGWKLEDISGKFDSERNTGIHQTGYIKKSLSLGSGLERKGTIYAGNDSEDGANRRFSCDDSHGYNGLVVPLCGKDSEITLPNQYEEALPSDYFHVSSDLVNNDSIFSTGDVQQSEIGGSGNSDKQSFDENADKSRSHMPCSPPFIIKSSSLPNIGLLGGSSSPTYLASHSRSSDDLQILDSRRKEMLAYEIGAQVIQVPRKDNTVSNNDKNNWENPADDGCDSCNYVGSAKDWIIPVMDEDNMVKNLQGKSSSRQWNELPSKDFKIKRIEDWVIDLQHCSPLEDTDEVSTFNDRQVERGSAVLYHLDVARFDGKIIPGMEAVRKYISSLSVSATAAQLANHGLVVIPFLSAFVSLRELNLSGNAIVRITAGALPRVLHALNLSKNNISTIEGLRELTRLRILNLSYNRIIRIGHGLASCSSLKELYLAGNKISEVEGLHRLLKLNVLDMRFNKISTAKCLGQLAANYNSLQAISLEGNPAQKNVGDEQLKKYLLGLLPHLVYFNRRSIKAGSLKDTADRSARLIMSTHQTDRGLRSEHKTLRRGSHGVSAHKTLSSSIHGRRSQPVDLPKQSKNRHGRLPPIGTKPTLSNLHQFYDISSKLVSFRPELSIRRTRSEGTLAAL